MKFADQPPQENPDEMPEEQERKPLAEDPERLHKYHQRFRVGGVIAGSLAAAAALEHNVEVEQERIAQAKQQQAQAIEERTEGPSQKFVGNGFSMEQGTSGPIVTISSEKLNATQERSTSALFTVLSEKEPDAEHLYTQVSFDTTALQQTLENQSPLVKENKNPFTDFPNYYWMGGQSVGEVRTVSFAQNLENLWEYKNRHYGDRAEAVTERFFGTPQGAALWYEAELKNGQDGGPGVYRMSVNEMRGKFEAEHRMFVDLFGANGKYAQDIKSLYSFTDDQLNFWQEEIKTRGANDLLAIMAVEMIRKKDPYLNAVLLDAIGQSGGGQFMAATTTVSGALDATGFMALSRWVVYEDPRGEWGVQSASTAEEEQERINKLRGGMQQGKVRGASVLAQFLPPSMNFPTATNELVRSGVNNQIVQMDAAWLNTSHNLAIITSELTPAQTQLLRSPAAEIAKIEILASYHYLPPEAEKALKNWLKDNEIRFRAGEPLTEYASYLPGKELGKDDVRSHCREYATEIARNYIAMKNYNGVIPGTERSGETVTAETE